MNHSAQGADSRGTITLRVVDRRTVPYLCRSEPGTTNDNHHCLLHLVELTSPKIRSTRARRLRLKDNLSGGSANRNARILSRDLHFWDYLQQINLTAYDAEIDARRARHFINRVCAVSGRHKLDHDTGAAQRFFKLIERPFLEWLRAAD
ncbi:MAG TPA: hypothetical protein ENI74_00855 [Gammaproteobacteria bacterium]|nr:hypothetical protein [Gammaproteobacteria bacterium]